MVSSAPPLFVGSIDDLRALRQVPRAARHRTLLIQLPGLAENEAHEISERLTAHANECGCSHGARAMSVAAVAALLWLAVVHGPLTAAFLWRSPWSLFWALAGAAAGKIIGLLDARRRLRRDIDRFIGSMTLQGE
jgi:hypothetical protein